MSTTTFSRIIEEVRKRPELWCKNNDGFRNRALHKRTWRQIAAKLHSDETLVKKRWKHLKDQYRKELKKTPYIDENTQHVNSWMHYKSMEFIRNELLPLRPRQDKASQSPLRSNQSESDEDDVDQSESDVVPSTTTTPEQSDENSQINYATKRMMKMTSLVERHIKACEGDSRKDPDYMFLMSIMPSMKKLSDIQKFVFRGKVNDWLLEAMTQNEFNVQCDTDSKYFLQSQLEVECQEGAELTNLNL